MTSASTTLSTPVLKKAIDRYYKQLQDYKGRADTKGQKHIALEDVNHAEEDTKRY